MKQYAKKSTAILSIILISTLGIVACIVNTDYSHGAASSLKVKAGFYGGPYYDVKVYTDNDMRNLSDGNVWTYSGVDSGNFMRVCYAWGVPLDILIDDVGIELDAVKYLHMGTSDSYNESYSTFSANTLLGTRYFFPNFVNAATSNTASEITIDFNKVDSSITGAAYTVPTLLAIGSTEFSRAEAKNVLDRSDYLNPGTGDLSESHKYRLIYGQAGITNSAAAYNVQTSDKWVYEINVQLAGAPNITVEKELISGKAGKIGSKYEVTVNVNLPSSYGFLDSDTQAALQKQIAENLQSSYDSSKVKLTKQSNGKYEMEVVGEGESELSFSYSRTEYDKTVTSAQAKMTFTTTEEKPENKPGDGDSGGPSGGSSNTGDKDNSGSDSDEGGKNIGKNAANYQKKTGANKSSDSDSDSDSATGSSEWASANMSQASGTGLTGTQKENGLGGLGAGMAILFLAGFAGTVVNFYRNV